MLYLRDIFCKSQEVRNESRSVMFFDFLSCKRATVVFEISSVIVVACIKL